MGVTNGFLRLSRDELSAFESDSTAFERRCRDYQHPDYLDMDKAGYELLFILNPAFLDPDHPESKSPAIADLLGGGTIVHRDLDLGYGPARILSDSSMRSSLDEFKSLDFADCYAMASTEFMSQVLLCEMNEEAFRQYHWSYLQTLAGFVAETVLRDMALLRY
jgi:hypothetical protein